MSTNYLHNHKDFPDLLRILEDETGILAGLIEKDYWIMHALYGLKTSGFNFELKGGTSLSKGYQIIDRFSEDIDIHIKPPTNFGINENPKNTKPANVEARRKFYDWLAETIKMDGIISVERDHAFDDTVYYRSGGIRLHYESKTDHINGIKNGILLEAGFDTVTPNINRTISSWAYDKTKENKSISIIDNRAIDIACYHPGYTFVEKLQTVATKFRQKQNGENDRPNFMRQYYDIYCLLGNEEVQKFIGTQEYETHKQKRFPAADLEIPIPQNESFLLNTPELRGEFKQRYVETAALYYKGQPTFDDILSRIKEHLHKL
ncbi:Nucleotidyl transferase AbiEii toxin, Type IV TA system [Chitinophaga sp. YR573]|uniref:nucleotidyl transferase AbiEii/AbiGii toxin family protein n=1 Tax=Chitinophaga sp. YR573 TaxID=1881040 RepID=UPI0008BF1A57|nr:nucleotidyl transferase AbiEii/AbiGii toxin family protein [Chitinophaga sp. YR573]SEW26872.1 Nucleotidyl transferase AbiEii toxin, Type IV TA system [Chitinophaga sp. YR573]